MEPACAVLEIAPSTYYAAKKREEYPPARDARDEKLKREIMRVWKEKGRGVYGARKVWHGCTTALLETILLVVGACGSESPDLSDGRSKPGRAGSVGRPRAHNSVVHPNTATERGRRPAARERCSPADVIHSPSGAVMGAEGDPAGAAR